MPGRSKANGISERKNLTQQNSASTLLYSSKLPQDLWPEAVTKSNDDSNASPTSNMEISKTPYEIWFGRKPNIQQHHVFGELAIALRDDRARSQKFEPNGKPYVYLGRAENRKGHLL